MASQVSQKEERRKKLLLDDGGGNCPQIPPDPKEKSCSAFVPCMAAFCTGCRWL